MKHLVVLGGFVVAIALAAVLLHERASGTIRFRDRDYLPRGACTTPYPRDLPLRRAGGVYVPSHMPRGQVPGYVYVRSGGCWRAYDLEA